MKKSFLYTIGSIFLLGVLVVTIPLMISWNQYKQMIQTQFQQATGRALTINGDIRFALLPSPRASLSDTIIANPPGALSKNFASVKNIDVGVALLPLLSKQVRITHIHVKEPAITLETMANGQNNWTFATPANKNDAASGAGSKDENDAQANMSIDDFSIDNAYIRLINVPQKSQQQIGPIDGKFEMGSLQGPFSGRGTLTVGKMPIRFSGKVEAIDTENGAQPIPFKASLSLLGNTATGDLQGTITREPQLQIKMQTALATKNLDKIIKPLPAALSPQTSLTGVLNYQNNQAAIDNLQFNSGSMEVSGGLAADMSGNHPRITLDIAHVVLPPLATTLQTSTQDSPAPADKPLAATLEGLFAQSVGLLDASIPANALDIVVTATQFALPHQPVMRDVRIAASLGEKGVTLQTADIKLPGATAIHLNGELPRSTDGKLAHATITAQITSSNIQAAFSEGVTGKATPLQLNTTAHLDRKALRLEPFALTQQGETVNGSILYTPQANPALQVAVKGSALDLDALLATPKTSATNKASTAIGNSTLPPTSGGDPLAKLKGLQARFNVDLGRVTYKNKEAKQVKLDALLGEKGVDLQTASIGDLGGMVITAQGHMDGVAPLKGVKLNVSGKTPSLSKTMQALGNSSAQNLGASSFTAAISGDADALKTNLQGTIDQGKIDLQATGTQKSDGIHAAGTIHVIHPETATIMRNFVNMTPTGSFGPFNLQTDFAWGGQTIQAKNLILAMGSAGTLKGTIDVQPATSGRTINAKLSADKLNLAALMGDSSAAATPNAAPVTSATTTPWSNEPIALDGIRGLNGQAQLTVGTLAVKKFTITDFAADLKFAGDTVTLQNLGGKLFDAGTFALTGTLTAAEKGGAHRGSINVSINNTDAKKLANAFNSKVFEQGILDASQKLSFTGATEAQLIASLTGDGQVKVTNGLLNGIDLDALAAKLDRPNSLSDFAAILDQARAGGQTKIGDVTIPMSTQKGVTQIQDTAITTEKTKMGVRGLINLPSKTVDLTGQIAFTEQRNLPQLTLFIRGPISAPQKSFDTRSFTQFYAQKATAKLQEKVQDKIGKALGLPSATQQPAPTESTPLPNTSDGTTATPSPTPAPAMPQPKGEDALKQLGGQLLNNILGGGQQ